MNSAVIRAICRLLIVSLVMLPFQAAQAGMIGAGKAAAAASSMAERDAVLAVVARANVASQLQTLGIDPKNAHDRIAAMTDEEVRSLAGKLDTLPAGASDGWAWAAAIAIAFAIWYFYVK